MNLVRWLPLPLLAACGLGLTPGAISSDSAALDSAALGDGNGGGGSGWDDSAMDTGVQGVTISVDSVDPSYGLTTGGETVTITGGPFDDSAVVRFGGAKGTVLSSTKSTLIVSTPAATSEGTVDVDVLTDSGSGTLPSGFTYYEDGTGKAGLLGIYGWFHYVGGYWGSPAPTDGGYAMMFFTPPTDLHFWQLYAPGIDQCAGSSWTYPGDVYYVDMGANSIVVKPQTGGSVTLDWNDTITAYSADFTSTSAYVQNGSYDLAEVDGSYAPPFSVSRFMKTPASFSVTSPAIAGNNAPTVSQSNLTIQWNGTASSSPVLIALFLFDRNYNDIEDVTCVANDDGSFHVPSSTFTKWSQGAYIELVVGRTVEEPATLPYNNAETRVLGVYWIVGAAYVR